MSQIIGEEGIIDFLNSAAVCLRSLDKDGVILWANQAELNFLGFSEHEYIGHSMLEFSPDIVEFNAVLNRIAQGESLYECPMKIRDKKGLIKHVLLSTSNYQDTAGCYCHTRCVTHDITSMVEKERKLERAKQEADLANHAKSKFLTNMSHELKTPLSSIMGFTQQLQRHLSEDDVRTQDSLSTIMKNAKQLLGLIHDILDLSKANADKLLLRPEILDINELVLSVFEQMKPLADAANLALSVTQPLESTASLIGDRKRITQILINLVSNAIKYTLEGSVTMSVESIVDVEMGPSIVIKVADTGIGIKPESFKYLFRSYSQLSEHGLSHIEGTGLGLAITDELVRMHRGRIGIDSFYGVGSCFSVLFPRFVSIDEFSDKVLNS